MKPIPVVLAVLSLTVLSLGAQEEKKVPKDSVRIALPGCTAGYIFTVSPRNSDETRSVSVRAGTHFRMNGPRKILNEIKAHEGTMIEVTGLILKGQYLDGGGVNVGGGVRIGPGSAPTGGSPGGSPTAGQNFIDVEGWRTIAGECPSK
jgi:hypothetical protein